ncbi:MAG: acetyl-CoA carboxylase, biotin carboxyl carrier protein [Omnitrophica bacterium GWA2_52_8]|nr:MAG: acetyl-CoA carboxylase, biotin carboxyl carrier protein [Omnitrophica bacterium GWA2_52_8]
MNIRELKEMLQLMKEHELSEVEIEKEGLKIRLKKACPEKMIAEAVSYAAPRTAAAGRAAAEALGYDDGAKAGTVPVVEEGEFIKSPMVGTFYSAPAPDQPPYVAAGQRVNAGDVLCIVEAMKLMNEIKAEVSGMVIEVMVQNGQPVEFDQPLFKIKKG